MNSFLLILLLFISVSHLQPIQKYSEKPVNIEKLCKKNNLCNNGTCTLISSITSCRCDKPYVDHQGQACAEKGNSMLSAFLLSFFLGGLGADWFYMSSGDSFYIFIGIIKLVTIFLLPLSFCWFWRLGILSKWILDTYSYTDTNKTGCAWIILFCVLPGMMVVVVMTGSVWWVVDWARVVDEGRMVKWTDGRGVALYIDMY